MITREDIKLFRAWQRSPIAFIKDMWGLEPQPLKQEFVDIAKMSSLQDYVEEWFQPFEKGKHITWQQWVILMAVEKGNLGLASRKISISSGHGIGKTACISWLILWYLICHKDCQIPCTAPTATQIYDVLWKEVAVWMNRMPERFKELLDHQRGYVRVKENSDVWFARAKTARKEAPEALAGVHAEYVMFVVDESSGVPEEIFRTAEGSMTGDNVLVILISNPTRLIGYFYDSHHKMSHNFQTFSFSGEDSPIVDWEFVDGIEQKHGKDSDEYKIRVLGVFPSADAVDDKGYVPLLGEDQIKVIPRGKITGVMKKLGVDPAGQGADEASWCLRDSFKADIIIKEKVSTPISGTQKTLTALEHFKITSDCVYIDSFGIGSKWVEELLRSNEKGFRGVNVGDQANDQLRFKNLRAEIFWRVREWLIAGGEIMDEKLKEELLWMRYRRDPQGRIEIMPKEMMKKDYGVPSPNRADAFALTFTDIDRAESDEYEQEEYVEQFPGTGV
jgi:phage terminase large subunit